MIAKCEIEWWVGPDLWVVTARSGRHYAFAFEGSARDAAAELAAGTEASERFVPLTGALAAAFERSSSKRALVG